MIKTPQEIHASFVRIWDRDPYALIELLWLLNGEQESVDPSYERDLKELGFLNPDGSIDEMTGAVVEACVQESRGSARLLPLPETHEIIVFPSPE